MPQALLPLIPDGATALTDRISVVKEGPQWTYFCGIHPVFMHAEQDRASFRMFTSQLVCQGVCKQADLIRVFGVSANSVRRGVAKYEQQGAAGFFQPRKTRGATVLTDEVTTRAQALLSQGSSRRQVAEQLHICYDTLRKAIHQGRLHEPAAETNAPTQDDAPGAASDQSSRSVADAAAEMGVACTRPGERVLAALGMLHGAPTRFENCRDVSFGGVLCALPALVANGLFEHLPKVFPALGGYYTTLQVIALLAYMALCRIKTVERLQYESPGELGKLLGLDRVPEVRCLRNKLSQLSVGDAPAQWAGLLSAQWLEADPERTGTLYVDGHVRVYHGQKTELPRRYVARQRLCLRGTTDYWVNDALGLPFFAVERPIDQGLLEALQSDIVPRLLADVPGQPTPQELEADPHRCRFVIVFDREGYSPAFFQEMWQTHRIACITYHKFPQENWPEAEFAAHTLHPVADREDHQAVTQWEQQKSELRETIEHLEHDLDEIQAQRKATPHHLAWDELEAADKFERLAPSRKRLLDTVKLIAYRAETALVTIVRSTLSREDDARSLVCDLFRSPADITPDIESGTLRIGIHGLANPRSNRAIGALLEELNASELTYPGTRLKLVYTLLAGSADEKHATTFSA